MDTPNPSGPSPEQCRVLWIALTALAVSSLLAIAALVFFGFITFLSWSYPILLPIGLAVMIALVLDPIVNFVQKRGLSRSTATLLVCLLTVIGFMLFWAYILPPLVRQAGDFFKSLPALVSDGVAKLQASLSTAEERLPPTPVSSDQANHVAAEPPATNAAPVPPQTSPRGQAHGAPPSELVVWLKENIPAIQQEVQKNLANMFYAALGPVGQAFGFLLGFGFVPIYVYYFLADQENIARNWQELVPLRRSRLRDEVILIVSEINVSLVSYFRGQIIVAACNGVLTFIGLWAIGIPNYQVLGVMAGALSIVPFLGIIVSIIPALLLGFLSAKSDPTLQWLRPVLVLGVFAGVQMCESMFITPRVQSHSTGLHPLAIILGILFWSLLLPGLLGPIVAVPLTCAAVVLLRRYVWQSAKG